MFKNNFITYIIQPKIKSLCLIDVSNPIFHLVRSDSKRFLLTSSALSLIMISILSLFEYITHSSSLYLENIYCYC